LKLTGSYPKDRQRLLAEVEAAVVKARQYPQWYEEVPDYREELY
jgi:hypothetical protein